MRYERSQKADGIQNKRQENIIDNDVREKVKGKREDADEQRQTAKLESADSMSRGRSSGGGGRRSGN